MCPKAHFVRYLNPEKRNNAAHKNETRILTVEFPKTKQSTCGTHTPHNTIRKPYHFRGITKMVGLLNSVQILYQHPLKGCVIHYISIAGVVI